MIVADPPPPADWSGAVASWLLALRAAGHPETTVALRAYQLGRLGRDVAPTGPWELSGAQLVAWLGSQGWQPATLRSSRSAVRGFYRWAHGLGYVDVDPSLVLPRVAPTRPNPHPTPEDAYRAALARSDARVRLMLRLAGELGLRRGEVARVRSEDLELALNGWMLVVLGKGARVRRLPITPGLRGLVRDAGPGWIFPGAVGGHLSAKWVGTLVARALPPGWSMHSLRHRFATAAHSIDRDLLTVQELLGHASPVTTRMYIRLSDERLRLTVAAVGRL